MQLKFQFCCKSFDDCIEIFPGFEDYSSLGEKHTFFTDHTNVTNLVNVNENSSKPLSFFHRATPNPVNWCFPTLVCFSFQILFLSFLFSAGTGLEGCNMPVRKGMEIRIGDAEVYSEPCPSVL